MQAFRFERAEKAFHRCIVPAVSFPAHGRLHAIADLQRTVCLAAILMELLVKQLAIPLSNQKTVAKWLVIAIRLSCRPKAPASHWLWLPRSE